MKNLTDTEKIKNLIDTHIFNWHKKDECEDFSINAGILKEKDFLILVTDILMSNYKLWHLEDIARDPVASDSVIADIKRKIDKENQLRNDKIETLDIHINDYLKNSGIKPLTDDFNSETPGSIIDKITILSLKIYHMQEQTERKDSTQEHINSCRDKLAVLNRQRDDLLVSLKKLITELLNGEKVHKIYFQFKMYNDPNLNPAIYSKS
jgi:hypothetical protein